MSDHEKDAKMRKIENKVIVPPNKKVWTKTKDDEPNIIVVRSKELKKYIVAAARSGGCPGWGR